MIIKPKRLDKGDTVGVIAPASPPNEENLRRGLSFLEELGLTIKLGKHLFKRNGYLAGSDHDRLEDLHAMFADQQVKAVFCACGGYGTARIADQINYQIISDNPKVFWGYSDITFLHAAIHQLTGLVTFHGPMLASDIGNDDSHPVSRELFRQLFQPELLNYSEQHSRLKTLVAGSARGPLVGGNLSLLTSTMGTPFEVDTKGKLLLIEDINEEPRSIDRMLNQLKMAGKLDDAAGFIVGDFKNCLPEREDSLTLEEVVNHYIAAAGKPALSGFMIGHCSPNLSLPLGCTAHMDADQKKLSIESGIQ
ncbi:MULTISPECIES: S66 peptidase family protein [Bacillus]|uniref:S66 peptidase family protein n=1 Tax=Bacillus TaxID=1386 RepID=UPI000C76DC59|nr:MULTISPECIES: LD-carboxypeptidase [Bacillus]PLR81718.1 LD-carboxypeptidase [Bacillus sp. V33-4]RSK43046.1 LD-carboxypeptidase [Bacillus canaveralius]